MKDKIDGGVSVEHRETEKRFAARVEGQESFIEYDRADGQLIIRHTEVPPALEGRGIAGELTRAALAYARRESLEVVPLCPFAAAYIRRHPEYLELVAPAYREQLSRR